MIESTLPILIPVTALVTALVVFCLRPNQHRLRNLVNLVGAGLKLLLVGGAVWGVLNGWEFEWRQTPALGFDLLLRIDRMSLLMLILSTTLWFITIVYAIGYMGEGFNLNRFFGFLSLCITATAGISLAGNLVTFLLFYETLTLVTYPLVVHKAGDEALRAGRVYLFYTLIGGAVFFLGVVWLNVLAGPTDFAAGGHLQERFGEDPSAYSTVFALLILGLGVKAALVPLHGWLPRAMVAPAPVSALLHAVAVVKAGVFGILRVIYDVYGVTLAAEHGLLAPLGVVAAVTIVWGSLRAMAQVNIKKMLAYSTVSQLSYIVIGACVPGLTSTVGSVAHLIHQGVMKITLFFCAGAFEREVHVKKLPEMKGIGGRMPLTMLAFTVAALGMIGLPPSAGFVSKWYLGIGSVEGGQLWVGVVLLLSTLLNAAYFLPPVFRGWFEQPEKDFEPSGSRLETQGWMLYPLLATALLTILIGLFAGASVSTLELARLIAEEMYRR